MQKNYLQFLIVVIVAIGMVMIAGVRQDLNSLEDQLASSSASRTATDSLRQNAAITADNMVLDSGTVVKGIEAMAQKYGWVKQSDNSYLSSSVNSSGSSSVSKHYICENCSGVSAACCVDGPSAFQLGSGGYCGGTQGSVVVPGICSTAFVANPGSATTAQREGRALVNGPAATNETTTEERTGRALVNSQEIPPFDTTRTSYSMITMTLRRGMSGSNQVKTVQSVLNKEGFLASAPTGYFGQMTFNAVKAFQTAYGIVPASGLVGPLTTQKIHERILQCPGICGILK